MHKRLLRLRDKKKRNVRRVGVSSADCYSVVLALDVCVCFVMRT